MNNNAKIHNASCSSSEESVAYLYDELSAEARTSFETHLAECDKCTGEFADLSFARLNVYEWHRDEFAEMATPRIVVPYAGAAKISWVDSVRAFFASPGQWAAAGSFAVIAVAFGVWMVLPTGTEVASVSVPQPGFSTEKPVSANIEEPRAANVVAVDKGSTDSEGQHPADEAVENRAIKTTPPKVVKAPATRAVKTSRNELKAVQATQKTAPRLNDFEDEDDNTLRLGDLLAEVDSRN